MSGIHKASRVYRQLRCCCSYRLETRRACFENLNSLSAIHAKQNDVLSVGRCEWCIHRSRTDETMLTDDLLSGRVKLHDSNCIGRSATTVTATLAFFNDIGSIDGQGDV